MGEDYRTRFSGQTKEAERIVEVKPKSLFKEKMVRVGIVGTGGKCGVEIWIFLKASRNTIVLFLGGLYAYYKYYQVKKFES